ncbi:MAG: ATP-dependent 6-phosphofructokinase [Planctomycetota bacterium]
MKRIGVLTGGGDAPGLNAAIKAVVYRAIDFGIETLAVWEGWSGLMEDNWKEASPLDYLTVRTWDRDGGTNLGSSRTNPFSIRKNNGKNGEEPEDRSDEAIANIEKLGLDGLVAMGGEDTLGVAARLSQKGVPVVGVPKTIDKDLLGTDYTLGFDTAVNNLKDMIERSRTSAGSHRWVQIVEAMGRHAGHLAFWGGVAGAATIILVPECTFRFERIREVIEERFARGKKDHRFPRYAVICASEGAIAEDGEVTTANAEVDAFGHVKLGGLGERLGNYVRTNTEYDARVLVPAHSQRGGSPSSVDRMMGTLFGFAAVDLLVAGKSSRMVSAQGVAPGVRITDVPIVDVLDGLCLLDIDRLYDRERMNINRGHYEGCDPE